MIDDRYRLDERIAAGGVGRVWRATDLLLERPVAVKLLRPEYAEHKATLARFHKEARHAGALNHPCVAAVYDYGHSGSGGPPYLVMELIAGPSLADLLAVEPIEPAFALDVIAQCAGGLHAAHRIGLIHRDVKPGNILIAPQGRVKITDFGIATAAGQTPVTAPGLVMGTMQYMAPERIDGGPGTPASDLYALGIVLHECLTGVPPYDGTPAEVIAAHLYAPLPPLPALVPVEIGALIAALTAKDPRQRISDASEAAARAARLRDRLRGGRPTTGRLSQAVPVQGGPRATENGSRPTRAARPPAGDTEAYRPAGLARPVSADRPARRGGRPIALTAAAVLLAGLGVAGLLAAGALSDGPSSDRARVRPPASPGQPALRATPSATSGSAFRSARWTAPAATAAAVKPPERRVRRVRDRPVPSSGPSATASPVPRASPTLGGPASTTAPPAPTPSPSGAPPSSPAPAPSPTLPPSPSPSVSPPPLLPIPLLTIAR